jgi:hypothetical protein
LVALEALPDAATGNNRPYVPEAELQLDGALRDLREQLVLGHEGVSTDGAFTPDGKRIVTGSLDKLYQRPRCLTHRGIPESRQD